MSSYPATAAVVVVDCDGRLASWDGTDFRGDAEIVDAALEAVELRQQVPVLGLAHAVAGDADPIAAAAALCAFAPGRTILVENPQAVTDWLDGVLGEHDEAFLA